MPRRVQHKLEKVVSTNISKSQFDQLAERARDYYINKHIPQPTISEILRYIIQNYLDEDLKMVAVRRTLSETKPSSIIQKGPQRQSKPTGG